MLRRSRIQRVSVKELIEMGKGKKRSKFGAVKTVALGELYDSKLEARYAEKLELMKHAILPDRERPVDVKRQVSIQMVVNGMLICTYRCDFVVEFADGHVEYHEPKGLETAVWNIKQKLFRALFPDRRLVVIRQVR